MTARKIDYVEGPMKPNTPNNESRHDAPILALAIVGKKTITAAADGRVLVLDEALRLERVLHDDADAPITTLAPYREDGVIGAGKSLFAWDGAGKLLAKAALPAVAVELAVRGDVVYVLVQGKILSFEGQTLTAKKSWRHQKGEACALDVDDAGTRAIVVRDNKQVEILDLAKSATIGDWTRKGRIDRVAARFGAATKPKKPAPIITADDDNYRATYVKDTTGRITGEVMWLDSRVRGPLVLDRSRGFAVAGLAGGEVEVIDIAGARSRFLLDPEIGDASANAMAALKRIPTFKQLAPGMFVRHGSIKAPPVAQTLSALALADGGTRFAAGFFSGEVIVADIEGGGVQSTHRGALAENTCRYRRPPLEDGATTLEVGEAIWMLDKDQHFVIADLANATVREGVTLAKLDEGLELGPLTIERDTITSVSNRAFAQWSRHDGRLLASCRLPENKGAFFDGARLLLLPEETLGHEGCDVVALDPATGKTTRVARFERDAKKFPLGHDPKRWVAFGCVGAHATLTIWAGSGLTVAQVFAFDLATGRLGESLPWAADATGDYLPEDAEEEGVTVRDLRTNEIVERYPFATATRRMRKVAFDPKTRRIATSATSTRVVVWSVDGKRLHAFEGHRDVNAIWLGARAVLVGDRAGLRMWEMV